MWTDIELLVFNNSERIISTVLQIGRLLPKIRLFGSDGVQTLDATQSCFPVSVPKFNFAEGVTLKNSECFFEFRLSPTNQGWNEPKFSKQQPNEYDGQFFDLSSRVAELGVTEFPSYIRIGLKHQELCDRENLLADFFAKVGSIDDELTKVIGCGNSVAHMVDTKKSLLQLICQHTWTEDWKTIWHRPSEILVGNYGPVLNASIRLGGRVIGEPQHISAIVGVSQSAGMQFLCDRMPDIFVRQFLASNGEFQVGGIPLFTRGRHTQLRNARMLRPLRDCEILLPVLAAKFLENQGILEDEVLAIEVHQAAAERFHIAINTMIERRSLDMEGWKQLHVQTWRTVFGLRADLIEFLCGKYFQ